MSQQGSLTAQRLDLAGTRSFTEPGAGGRRRAALADHSHNWLGEVWAQATQGRVPSGFALAAVGSLARADAGPLSDYDLVLLHYGRSLSESEVTALADRIWYPIWDAGVRLDHSVRTVNQCRSVAQSDLSAAVGLLDLAPVAGDPEVVTATRTVIAHDWRGGARKRLPDLLDSLAARHRRYDELAHSIEPDLKEAHGGLRDMLILRALTAAWLADRPRGPVDEANELLLDVRDALHVVTGRSRDRLGREDQDAVAALLGRPSADDLLTDVSWAGRTIAYALDGTVRKAGQSQRARTLRVGPRRPQMTPLGFGMFASDGEVVLGAQSGIDTDPMLPLRAAVVAARAGLPISPVTLGNLAARSPALPDPWPPLARDLFADLLAAGPGLVGVWEGLDQAGIIETWIPQWAPVRSRPQHNPVHRHTVDRHLIETVVYAASLVRQVARADLLLVAALLHDIGKLPDVHDHSVTGAPIARDVARRLGFGAEDAAVVQRLVAEHLTVIELATRRDPRDPATVAAAVTAAGGDEGIYDLLLALTEADANAAGPKAWTDWRAALLRQLDQGVRVAFARQGTDAESLSLPGETGIVLADEVLTAVGSGEPHVRVSREGGARRVEVHDRDRLGLFADTAGLLAAQGLLVRTAILRTIDGIAVDEWHVEAPGGAEPDPQAIARGLHRLATGDRSPLGYLAQRRAPARTPGRGDGVPGQARAFVVPGACADATVLEVRAADRRGLLHELGRAFAGAGVSVRSAHVATYAGQTLDTFYVTDVGGRPLEPAAAAAVVALVIDTCEGAGAQ